MTESTDSNYYSNETATFGDRVAAARDAQGMTQKALARRLGTSLKTIEKWEDDISEPRANKLQMLAGILNVSISWLLTGEGQGVEPEDVETNAEISQLLAEIRILRTDMLRSAERMGRLEKRLKATVVEPAE